MFPRPSMIECLSILWVIVSIWLDKSEMDAFNPSRIDSSIIIPVKVLSKGIYGFIRLKRASKSFLVSEEIVLGPYSRRWVSQTWSSAAYRNSWGVGKMNRLWSFSSRNCTTSFLLVVRWKPLIDIRWIITIGDRVILLRSKLNTGGGVEDGWIGKKEKDWEESQRMLWPTWWIEMQHLRHQWMEWGSR